MDNNKQRENIFLKMRFFFLFLFWFSFSSVFASVPVEFLPNAHLALKEKYRKYSPVHGWNLWKSGLLTKLKNWAGFGQQDPKFYAHYQLRPEDRKTKCPGNPLAAWVHRLYPLGEPNNASNDPVRDLPPHIMGMMLQWAVVNEESLTAENLEKKTKELHDFIRSHFPEGIKEMAFEDLNKGVSEKDKISKKDFGSVFSEFLANQKRVTAKLEGEIKENEEEIGEIEEKKAELEEKYGEFLEGKKEPDQKAKHALSPYRSLAADLWDKKKKAANLKVRLKKFVFWIERYKKSQKQNFTNEKTFSDFAMSMSERDLRTYFARENGDVTTSQKPIFKASLAQIFLSTFVQSLFYEKQPGGIPVITVSTLWAYWLQKTTDWKKELKEILDFAPYLKGDLKTNDMEQKDLLEDPIPMDLESDPKNIPQDLIVPFYGRKAFFEMEKSLFSQKIKSLPQPYGWTTAWVPRLPYDEMEILKTRLKEAKDKGISSSLKNGYSNCREAAILSLFNILLYDEKKNEISLQYLSDAVEKVKGMLYGKETTGRGLFAFYNYLDEKKEKPHPNPRLQAGHPDVHHLWSAMVATHLNLGIQDPKLHIDYVHKDFEISGRFAGGNEASGRQGLMNMLRVMARLIGTQNFAQFSKKETAKEWAKELDGFCTTFSRADFELSFKVYDCCSDPKTFIKNPGNPVQEAEDLPQGDLGIVFSVNQVPTFWLYSGANHGQIYLILSENAGHPLPFLEHRKLLEPVDWAWYASNNTKKQFLDNPLASPVFIYQHLGLDTQKILDSLEIVSENRLETFYQQAASWMEGTPLEDRETRSRVRKILEKNLDFGAFLWSVMEKMLTFNDSEDRELALKIIAHKKEPELYPQFFKLYNKSLYYYSIYYYSIPDFIKKCLLENFALLNMALREIQNLGSDNNFLKEAFKKVAETEKTELKWEILSKIIELALDKQFFGCEYLVFDFCAIISNEKKQELYEIASQHLEKVYRDLSWRKKDLWEVLQKNPEFEWIVLKNLLPKKIQYDSFDSTPLLKGIEIVAEGKKEISYEEAVKWAQALYRYSSDKKDQLFLSLDKNLKLKVMVLDSLIEEKEFFRYGDDRPALLLEGIKSIAHSMEEEFYEKAVKWADLFLEESSSRELSKNFNKLLTILGGNLKLKWEILPRLLEKEKPRSELILMVIEKVAQEKKTEFYEKVSKWAGLLKEDKEAGELLKILKPTPDLEWEVLSKVVETHPYKEWVLRAIEIVAEGKKEEFYEKAGEWAKKVPYETSFYSKKNFEDPLLKILKNNPDLEWKVLEGLLSKDHPYEKSIFHGINIVAQKEKKLYEQAFKWASLLPSEPYPSTGALLLKELNPNPELEWEVLSQLVETHPHEKWVLRAIEIVAEGKKEEFYEKAVQWAKSLSNGAASSLLRALKSNPELEWKVLSQVVETHPYTAWVLRAIEIVAESKKEKLYEKAVQWAKKVPYEGKSYWDSEFEDPLLMILKKNADLEWTMLTGLLSQTYPYEKLILRGIEIVSTARKDSEAQALDWALLLTKNGGGDINSIVKAIGDNQALVWAVLKRLYESGDFYLNRKKNLVTKLMTFPYTWKDENRPWIYEKISAHIEEENFSLGALEALAQNEKIWDEEGKLKEKLLLHLESWDILKTLTKSPTAWNEVAKALASKLTVEIDNTHKIDNAYNILNKVSKAESLKLWENKDFILKLISSLGDEKADSVFYNLISWKAFWIPEHKEILLALSKKMEDAKNAINQMLNSWDDYSYCFAPEFKELIESLLNQIDPRDYKGILKNMESCSYCFHPEFETALRKMAAALEQNPLKDKKPEKDWPEENKGVFNRIKTIHKNQPHGAVQEEK